MPNVSRFFPYSIVLPNMPGVATRLLGCIDDDSVGLSDMADLIGKDAALAAKVVRVANTARYSPLRSVANLREATALMGMVTLRNLAMASCMASAFPTIAGLDRKRFWCHSIATAHYAVLVAQAAMLNSDAAYMGGLMLRTGQLLMAQVDKAGVGEVEAQARTPGSRFAIEQERWGCTHADVTAELATRWQFPPALIGAFASAGEPLATEPFSPLGASLHVATVLADALDLGVPGIDALTSASPELIERLHLNVAWFEDKLLAAADLGQEVDAMMG